MSKIKSGIIQKIEDVRYILNKQIENNDNKERILKTSIRLDKLINIYYTYNIDTI
ncbi:Spo0E family sporulation regulatory protein-aspartic acid phosphatase [[Clostridium] colinum]|uniref:Spo0E family sporulation regulatory protein-aspartic acid phosphatase n=1 Tax=[Clostridium] colinum TaxID=36835 RepID=UPI002025AE76|nr:Spo0E family sporulation regulatory protein-aspartic acid phosphatase [[Clostridium] colinum]